MILKVIAVIIGLIMFGCVLYRCETKIKVDEDEIDKEINDILGE